MRNSGRVDTNRWGREAMRAVILDLGMVAVSFSTTAEAYRMCPDGTYVDGESCRMAPDGSYVWGDEPVSIAPDGIYTSGRPRITPDGSYVCGEGDMRMCPDGSYVVGSCRMTPGGSYVGD
jgi:hypothetical protein